MVILVVVAVLVAVVVRTFVAASFYIPSGSMEHTLDINDRVLVYKLGYDFHAPERGDVVVFKAPKQWAAETGDGGDWIKRVIAVGGDKVAYDDAIGRITVNGKALTEPYIYRSASGVQDPPSEAPFQVTVPKGRLWLMGDHRSNSSDSREHYLQSHNISLSTVPVSSVVGRAFATYWPLGRMTWLSKPTTYDSIPDARAAN
ncbi:signal peptidase I [Actinocatenispora rupis]|nr:signal peptidase I [Actinocatenispora rupis]